MKHGENVNEAVELLRTQAQSWSTTLNEQQVANLRQYAELLATYTEANVIGTKDLSSIILDHVLDSLSANGLQGIALNGRLVDVGAGGGLPGIPLAIARPDLSITLLESVEKKVRFLRLARGELGLSNVGVENRRAEEAGEKSQMRDSFDLATSRALAALPVVVEYCAPLVNEGGFILAMKGRLERSELEAGTEAAGRLGAELVEVAQIELRPELEQKERRIVVFRKTRPTPTGYPRRVGLAKKRPLGA